MIGTSPSGVEHDDLPVTLQQHAELQVARIENLTVKVIMWLVGREAIENGMR